MSLPGDAEMFNLRIWRLRSHLKRFLVWSFLRAPALPTSLLVLAVDPNVDSLAPASSSLPRLQPPPSLPCLPSLPSFLGAWRHVVGRDNRLSVHGRTHTPPTYPCCKLSESCASCSLWSCGSPKVFLSPFLSLSPLYLVFVFVFLVCLWFSFLSFVPFLSFYLAFSLVSFSLFFRFSSLLFPIF